MDYAKTILNWSSKKNAHAELQYSPTTCFKLLKIRPVVLKKKLGQNFVNINIFEKSVSRQLTQRIINSQKSNISDCTATFWRSWILIRKPGWNQGPSQTCGRSSVFLKLHSKWCPEFRRKSRETKSNWFEIAFKMTPFPIKVLKISCNSQSQNRIERKDAKLWKLGLIQSNFFEISRTRQ